MVMTSILFGGPFDRIAICWQARYRRYRTRHPPLAIRANFATTRAMNDNAAVTHIIIPPEMAGWRLDRALAALIPTLSRERLKALISSGHVSSGADLTRDPATKVRVGTPYVVHVPPPLPAHNEAQNIPLTIVYEDDHLLVVDKPAGLVVHPAAGNFDGTLVNALLHHCAGRLSGIGGVARPGIVHRIDKDTSGLMLVAKTDRAHEGLAAQFAKPALQGNRVRPTTAPQWYR